MPQSFVTTAPNGWGIAENLTLFYVEAGYMSSTEGAFYGKALPKALLKSLSTTLPPTDPYPGLVKLQITSASLGMESIALQFHRTAETMLRSKHGPNAPLCLC